MIYIDWKKKSITDGNDSLSIRMRNKIQIRVYMIHTYTYTYIYIPIHASCHFDSFQAFVIGANFPLISTDNNVPCDNLSSAIDNIVAPGH